MISLEGNFYPPNSAQRFDAKLWLLDGGKLNLIVGSDQRTFTLGQVTISSPLGGIPRSLRFDDGSKFDCENDPRIGEWLESEGLHKGSNLVHRLERNWHWVIISLASVALAVVAAVIWGIPASASWLSKLVPTEVRVQVGDQTEAIVFRLLGDPVRADDIPVDLESGFRRLARPYVTRDFPITLYFFEGGSLGPNAFAIPNGSVVMTEEFVELAQADSVALLGVLAHEIGHLHHRHGMRRAIEASSLPVLISMVTGDLGSGAAMLGSIPVSLIQNGYSRDQEREADEFARDLLLEQGMPTEPVAELFERLRDEIGDLPGWMSTHPAHTERIDFFRQPPPS